MELGPGKHRVQGDIAGNINQHEGNHVWGIRLIPLGDRERDIHELGVSYLEERDSLDGSEKWLRKENNYAKLVSRQGYGQT